MGEYQLNTCATDDALAHAAASAWVNEIEAANRAGASHAVALSGGRIVKKFYLNVVELAQARRISLANVHFFWGDERCVPPEDEESNYRLAQVLLFEPLKLKAAQIHRIPGEFPASAAESAVKEITAVVPVNGGGQPVLDLIFLGMGEDGHVASLFPGEPETTMFSPAVYRIVMASKPPPQRVTVGYGVIVAARQVWVLASGKGKEGALRESLRSEGKTPLARVIKSRSKTQIFSDISL